MPSQLEILVHILHANTRQTLSTHAYSTVSIMRLPNLIVLRPPSHQPLEHATARNAEGCLTADFLIRRERVEGEPIGGHPEKEVVEYSRPRGPCPALLARSPMAARGSFHRPVSSPVLTCDPALLRQSRPSLLA